ncbi:MAG: hypothetical protein HGB10_08335 [Coriobacteriia bacterium]|nr:hypothetical protein [Coriobacteriia bacterium]
MPIPVRKWVTVLLIGVALVVVMHFATIKISPFVHSFFDLDREQNVPTWYSSALLLAVAISALVLATLRDATPRWSRGFWPTLALGYAWLSLDETAWLHEQIDGLLLIKWTWFYAPIALVFFVVIAYCLSGPDTKMLRRWVVGGLLVYALGGIGMELVNYLLIGLPRYLRHFQYAAEEGLEMLGTVMVLTGLLLRIDQLGHERSVALPKDSSPD